MLLHWIRNTRPKNITFRMYSVNVFVILCSLSLFLHTGVRCEDKVPTSNDGKLLLGKEREQKLVMMLQSPKATFYTRENMTGEAVNYTASRATYVRGCLDRKELESMRLSDTCVRVFTGKGCREMSRALYPKPNSGNFINFLTDDELPFVNSVGPCIPNEFQFASLSLDGAKISVTKDGSNVRQVPDFVDFTGRDTFEGKSTKIVSSTNPITNYYMDAGRPKWIQAEIYGRHLEKDGDGVTRKNLAIPVELGGPRNEAYNTFPQSEINHLRWKLVMSLIQPDLTQAKSDERFLVHLTFVYDNATVSTPAGFYFNARIKGGQSLYGFLEN